MVVFVVVEAWNLTLALLNNGDNFTNFPYNFTLSISLSKYFFIFNVNIMSDELNF